MRGSLLLLDLKGSRLPRAHLQRHVGFVTRGVWPRGQEAREALKLGKQQVHSPR